MVSDGAAGKAARLRCHVAMALIFTIITQKPTTKQGGRSSSRSAAAVPRFGGCNFQA